MGHALFIFVNDVVTEDFLAKEEHGLEIIVRHVTTERPSLQDPYTTTATTTIVMPSITTALLIVTH